VRAKFETIYRNAMKEDILDKSGLISWIESYEENSKKIE
jgi:hypothetical protein